MVLFASHFQLVDIVLLLLHGWNLFVIIYIRLLYDCNYIVAHHFGILDFQSGHQRRCCESVTTLQNQMP